MQTNDTSLSFLRETIQDIKVALFKSEINSEIALPNNIVETISTDAEGNVYFFTSCKGNYAGQLDRAFYAYLDYHKKGTDMRLCISGKAQIVKDGEEAAAPENEVRGISSRSIVLIKMKIMQAECYGRFPQQNISWMQKIRTTFSQLFYNNEERHYNFG